LGLARLEPQLLSHPGEPVPLEQGGVFAEGLRGEGDCLLRLSVQERQQRLGEAGQVPLRDRGLVAVRVAAAVVDRAEHRVRAVGVHERAGAVVDRLPGDRHVVGVHHPVDEADQLPPGHERGLAVHDGPEERQVLPRGLDQLGVVAADCVVGQRPQGRLVPARRQVLEGPDPNVA
jgi:hypothetical protein